MKPGQNKLFRDLNGLRKEEKWTCGSHLKKKNNKALDQTELAEAWRESTDILFFLLPFISFSDLRKLDRRFSSGQEQKMLYATRAMRGYQKHGIFPRIQVKVRKILIFSFAQIYGILMVKIFRTKN